MIASRRPRGRKCSAARMMACSKSGCSNSFTALALLRLPFPRILQRGQIPEFKSGKGIQPFPQCRKPARRLTELLADGPQDRPHTRRFRGRDLEQALEASRVAEVSQEFVHG